MSRPVCFICKKRPKTITERLGQCGPEDVGWSGWLELELKSLLAEQFGPLCKDCGKWLLDILDQRRCELK